MAHRVKWGATPGYTPESGSPPPGKFKPKAEVQRELTQSGAIKDARIKLLGEKGPWVIDKVEGGRIFGHDEVQPQRKRQFGLGAIEEYLPKIEKENE